MSVSRLVSTVMKALPKTLTDAVRYFASADNCRDYMVGRRWPKGVTCPQCGSTSVYFDQGRNGWECKTRHPKRKFTLKTGTIFEDSPLGLDKWLPAVWMIANCKYGVSSHELARSVGVTQKTAWFMLQRIRLAMQGEDGGKLNGEVEADGNLHRWLRALYSPREAFDREAWAQPSAQGGRHGPAGTARRRQRVRSDGDSEWHPQGADLGRRP